MFFNALNSNINSKNLEIAVLIWKIQTIANVFDGGIAIVILTRALLKIVAIVDTFKTL